MKDNKARRIVKEAQEIEGSRQRHKKGYLYLYASSSAVNNK